MSIKPKTAVDWTVIAVVAGIVLVLLADAAKAETKVGVHGGHWSKHLSSDDVTNERHKWIGVRINNITFGHAYNSYRQPGFSGEVWYVGAIGDIELGSNINRWQGDIVARGSIGAMHGYTSFAGHDPEKKPRWFPYAAAGLYYQQPITKTWEWEAGVMQFGDATIPSVGLEATF